MLLISSKYWQVTNKYLYSLPFSDKKQLGSKHSVAHSWGVCRVQQTLQACSESAIQFHFYYSVLAWCPEAVGSVLQRTKLSTEMM